jgi:hypothetical protein
MRPYITKEKAKITAGAITALVIVGWLAVFWLAILTLAAGQLRRPYLFGGGLVQCSCATASVHAVPSGSSVIQVSASLPPSTR